MKRNAFTLIELLVVIGVIAILMSLLLPALKKAKEYGKRTVCRENLKQSFLSLVYYSDSYDDWLPTSGNTTTGHPPCSVRNTDGGSGLYNFYSLKFVKKNQLFCPSLDFTNFYSGNFKYCAYYYRYNTRAITTYERYANDYQKGLLSKNRYATRFLMTDSILCRINETTNIINTRTTNWNAVKWAHREGGNVVYNDGAVLWKRNYLGPSNYIGPWPSRFHAADRAYYNVQLKTIFDNKR